jgi:HAD superfamily hydrolase (TIGR01509 family)
MHLLFDNDGVLVDSERLYFQANRDILAEYGVRLEHADFVHRSLTLGVGVFDLLPGLDAAAEAHVRERRNRHYDRLLASDPDLVLPGVPQVLDQLAAHPMAIVTSSRKDHFATIHRHTGLVERFAFVLAQGDYRRSKPCPDPYLAAVERFGVRPEDCLVIEDSPRGLASAGAAGIPCVVVRSPFTQHLAFAGAVAVIDRIDALPAVIASLVEPGAQR